MRVLHFYNRDVPQLAMYVGQLVNAMPEGVECRVADNVVDMRNECGRFIPDIIHQHGLPPGGDEEPLLGVGQGSAGSRPRLVISVHGQAVDTAKAYAVITRSPYEHSRQANPRKEMVRNPLITTTICFAEAAQTIAAVYQRVMDSCPLLLMNRQTRLALALMIKAAVCGDKRWVDSYQFEEALAGTDFRRLYIYAEQEGVLDIVYQGIDILETYAPEKQPTDNYLPEGYRVPEAMPGATVAEMVGDIAANGVCLLRLVEMAKALYDDRLDEEALSKELDKEKLKPLFQSLLQVLSEQTLLTEGFMPCPPLDNQTTLRMRQQLVSRQQIC